MYRVNSIGVMSLAKVSALLYAGISLLMVPFLLLFAALMSVAPKQPGEPPAMFFVAFALFAPFLYGVIGFIFGALAGFLYNLIAGWIGGIEMQLEIAPSALPPVPASPLPQP